MNRDRSIDVLKGIGILLVVLGHTGVGFTSFIYLFHMAIFFIASGYCSNDKYTDSIKSLFIYFKKKLKSLWLPYFTWSAICILLNNAFLSLSIYTDNQMVVNTVIGSCAKIGVHRYVSYKEIIIEIIRKFFFLGGSVEMSGTVWFLRTLFVVSVLYKCVDFVSERLFKEKTIIVQGILSVVFLTIGFCATSVFEIKNFMNIPTALSVYSLYYIGIFIKRYFHLSNKSMYILAILGFAVLIGFNHIGEISIGNNDYVNPLFMLVCSLSGWFLIYGISKLLVKVNYVSSLFEYCGKHSISIMLFHFISFKLITFIQIWCLGEPMYRLASFPVLHNDVWWIIVYVCVGIGVPLLINYLFNKVFRHSES